ncbi:MAG TPA: di-trans,poly-cis-decaprenylcistransferase, partial [Gammaproteobacteria bacterium]|nr:di-trans,poly-cis-decaprenylcistransferase [Gammaproteobacteria bacterium]
MKVQSSAPDLESVQSSIPRHVAIIMDGNNRW